MARKKFEVKKDSKGVYLVHKKKKYRPLGCILDGFNSFPFKPEYHPDMTVFNPKDQVLIKVGETSDYIQVFWDSGQCPLIEEWVIEDIMGDLPEYHIPGRDFQRILNDEVVASVFLQSHPIFYDYQAETQDLKHCFDFEYVWINTGTGEVAGQLDPGVESYVCFSSGPVTYSLEEKEFRRLHDPDLDVNAYSFDEAFIAFTLQVFSHYGSWYSPTENLKSFLKDRKKEIREAFNGG